MSARPRPSVFTGRPPRPQIKKGTAMMKTKPGSSVAAVTALEPLEPRNFAAGGSDPSFGTGVNSPPTSSAPPGARRMRSSALPGGKVLAVGRALTGSERQAMAITRFLADGSVDTAFGQRGQVVLNYGGNASAADVARQSDGRIVVAGFIDGQPFVARFSADGVPDTTFGQGGRVVLGGPPRYAARLALSPDGKVVLVTADTTDPAAATAVVTVVRLNPNGAFDKSFGGTGTVTTDFGPGDSLGGVVVRPDGRILVGGSFRQTDYQATGVALTQFTKDGTLDTSFAGTGSVRGHLFFGGDYVADLALDSKGRVLLLNGDGFHLALGRFRADGVLDRAFATRGVRDLLAGHDDLSKIDPGRLAVTAGDSVVVVGTAERGRRPPTTQGHARWV